MENNPNSESSTRPRYDMPPDSADTLGSLPAGTGGEASRQETKKKFNWYAYTFTLRLLKEVSVIVTAIYVLVMLVRLLRSFMDGISSVFIEAVSLKSAPVVVVKTMDWHTLVLGGALILSITTILMVMLKSVLSAHSRLSVEEEKKHAEWDEMPVGQFFTWVLDKIKSK